MRPPAARISMAGLLTVSLLSAGALADDTGTLWYGSLTGVYSMPSDSEAELRHRRVGTISGDIELSDETGFALAIGFETEGGQQVELELASRSTDIEGATGVRAGAMSIPSDYFTLNGDLDTLSLMVNARQLFGSGPFRPYIGGGLGFARHDGAAALAIAPIPALPFPGLEGEDSGDDTVFAYQFMAGVEFEMAEGAHVFGGYRYMASSDLEIERFTAGYATQSIEAGIRIRF